MNAAPISAYDPYTVALAKFNEERAAAALAAATAAAAPPPQPKPVAGAKPSLARRALNWVKRNLCCCLAKAEIEEPQSLPQPLLPQPELPAPLTEVPANMIVGFDGRLHEVYNPTSGKPCPHFLTTTNARTGEISCLNCKKVL
jgi:hypothetical protein